MTNSTAYDFSLVSIDGTPAPLELYRGKVLLIVNVASECGFTYQYEGLQKLHEKYADRGLVVMGVPSNDFGGQEPGSNEEIKAFCDSRFHVTFPMFSKIDVKGATQHPLYGWLVAATGEEVSWNFNKYLVDRKGQVLEHFGSSVKPESDELVARLDRALGAP